MATFPRLRPRRLRTRGAIRDLVREHSLKPADLIQPLFVRDGEGPDQPISSMPGQSRLTLPTFVETCAACWEAGVPAVALFPKVGDELKTDGAEEAWNPDGLVPRAVRAVKEAVPELAIICDVALDPYSAWGQDGIVVDGEIHNDLTLEALRKQAVCQAEAGADVVAPSDMMDGRVGAIREALDEGDHINTLILAYSAKYASAFYGPFRDALDSAPRADKQGPKDKKSYQMDPANGDEAVFEVGLDWDEGADIVMVKPGMPYLDVVWRVKQAYRRPVAVYQVSGEYAMFKAAAANGWIDERATVLEALLGFKRAGADMVLSYYAREAAGWLAS